MATDGERITKLEERVSLIVELIAQERCARLELKRVVEDLKEENEKLRSENNDLKFENEFLRRSPSRTGNQTQRHLSYREPVPDHGIGLGVDEHAGPALIESDQNDNGDAGYAERQPGPIQEYGSEYESYDEGNDNDGDNHAEAPSFRRQLAELHREQRAHSGSPPPRKKQRLSTSTQSAAKKSADLIAAVATRAEGELLCQACFRLFKSEKTYRRHSIRHTPERQQAYQCPAKGCTVPPFRSVRNFREHIFQAHNNYIEIIRCKEDKCKEKGLEFEKIEELIDHVDQGHPTL